VTNNSATENNQHFLDSAEFVDSDSPEVRAYAKKALEGMEGQSETDRAIRLFETVRDGLRYDPFTFDIDPESYKASHIIRQKSTWCVPKAILLTACLRAAGIPAAVGFADVKNHLNTPKLAELMQTDLFIYHGYVQLWLDGNSYKVTSAFNMELCQRFGVKPLIFDGKSDALFHEFDNQDRRHMEYVNDHGIFHDAPVLTILKEFRKAYPKFEELLTKGKTKVENGESGVEFSPVKPRRFVPGEKKGFDDFIVGERLLFEAGSISREEIMSFAREWDPQSLHLDEEYAKSIHGSLIASGFQSMLFIMRPVMFEMMAGCENIGGFGFDNLRWTLPVKPDEKMSVCIEITKVRESSSRPGIGIISYKIEARNPANQMVFKAETGALLKSRKAAGK